MKDVHDQGEQPDGHTSFFYAFFSGVQNAPGVAAVVLFFSFLGFGALAKESGVSEFLAVGIAIFVWALPGQVVLVSEIANGSTWVLAAFAVTLTSIRLMPLVATVMPLLKHDTAPRWLYYLAAHFVAITFWIEANRLLPGRAKNQRLPFFLGFALTLFSANLVATFIGYQLAASLGTLISSALLFLTPVYFASSMYITNEDQMSRLALVFGFVMGPCIFLIWPGAELLLSGLIGGTAAFILTRDKPKSGSK